jgi:hypothetical protein
MFQLRCQIANYRRQQSATEFRRTYFSPITELIQAAAIDSGTTTAQPLAQLF